VVNHLQLHIAEVSAGLWWLVLVTLAAMALQLVVHRLSGLAAAGLVDMLALAALVEA